ncbi:hypothetical protein [Sphingopyxis sp.]|uniref:hypothetical protein n=1 Tax=Sphingopyxis sp. TaxID=1908224 RepID=UPI002B48762E|nr:hypothetical protein [Sphingopyxis sp.]
MFEIADHPFRSFGFFSKPIWRGSLRLASCNKWRGHRAKPSFVARLNPALGRRKDRVIFQSSSKFSLVRAPDLDLATWSYRQATTLIHQMKEPG